MSEMNHWGKHYLADCAACDKTAISNRQTIVAFTEELVDRIDMKAYGPAMVEHFATHDPSKGGFTLCQMIETSLIDGHFVDESGDAYISVHSCKEFDPAIVREVIAKYFNPKSIKENVIYRQA